MFSSYSLTFTLLSFLSILNGVHASALTTAIAPNERLCFYADVDKAGEKIGVTCLTTAFTTDHFLTILSSSTSLCVQCMGSNPIPIDTLPNRFNPVALSI